MPNFIGQALRGEPLTVYGDGLQTVDMIYSRDLARHTEGGVEQDYSWDTLRTRYT